MAKATLFRASLQQLIRHITTALSPGANSLCFPDNQKQLRHSANRRCTTPPTHLEHELPGINSAGTKHAALTLGHRRMRAHPPERPQLHPLSLGRCTKGPELHDQLLLTIDQPAFTAAPMKGTIGGEVRTILHAQQLDRQGAHIATQHSQSN